MNLMRSIVRAVSASPHEWRTRAQQAAFLRVNELLARQGRAFFARSGHLRSLGISAEAITGWFQARRSSWFIDEGRRCRLQDYFAANPAAADEFVERAERIRRDEMLILGHGSVPFKGDDRWQRDHILGTVSPRQFYARIRYLDSSQVGDSKHVWEPNRFAWVYWLGGAHLITAKDAYAATFCELTRNWFEKNPYPVGINYCSALEVALRAYACVWALNLFRDRLAADGALLDRLIQGIWTSCRHVENNLSYYFAPNTHLLGEAFSLYACGAAIPEFRESARWQHLGAEILAQEAGKQFHRDGTHRELSTSYHLYATDFYLQAVLIARQTGFCLPPIVETVARKAVARLGGLVTADLTLPRLNDCDDGRLDWFGLNPLDAAPSLLAARTLWPDLVFDNARRSVNGYHLWMGAISLNESGLQGAPEVRTDPADSPSVGPSSEHENFDSGIVVYRNPGRDYLLFRCGPFGYMDCGHSHDGPTSLILHLAGRPVIVDSGTGAYTQTSEIRNRFREAFGKNVLLLEGRGPSSPSDWFQWQRKTPATLTCVQPTASGFECAGFHDGFTRAFGFSARVWRRLALDNAGTLVAVDQWDATQPVAARLAWTLHPDWFAEIDEFNSQPGVTYRRGVLRDGSGSQLYFLIGQFPPDTEVVIGPSTMDCDADDRSDCSLAAKKPTPHLGESKISVVSGPYSPGYGVVQETQYLVMDFTKSNAGCTLTAFSRVGELKLLARSTGRIVVRADQELAAIAGNPAGQRVL